MIAISLERYALPLARAALRERVPKQRYDAALAARPLALTAHWNALRTPTRNFIMPVMREIRQKPRDLLRGGQTSIGLVILGMPLCTGRSTVTTWRS